MQDLRSAMFEKTWAPKPIPETYVLTEAVTEVTGVDKKALLEWVANGLLPPPLSARGRGIVSKWPVITLELGKFVREYRDKGFALREIRPMLIKAFGPRILKVVQEPRPYRGKDKAAAAEAAASTASASKKTAAKKTAAKTAATTTSSKKKTRRAS
jgi:DNA-binding transcriptional MerR regulator